jgi:ABC-type glycerol-3-phosphate transport system permease component
MLKYKNVIAMFLYIPTIVGAGLIPWYYTIKEVLGLANTIWVLILPSLVSSYNIFLIRNYYKGIPDSFSEAAEIEGAGAFTIFLKVMTPLALPIIATIVLFVSLGYWNDWFNATWFIDFNHRDLYPLQYYLFQTWQRFNSAEGGSGQVIPMETGYMATMFVTMGPIVMVYPFVQKYLIKGLTAGAVKG